MIRRPNPRWPWLVIVFATAALAFLHLHPVASTVTRLAGLGAGVMLWGGLVMLSWRRRVLRAALVLLPVVLAAPFFLPARLIHPLRLRTDMMGRLRALEGVRYVWGGESARGIDCSGLPRKALRDALFALGLRTGNGGALRQALSLWWHDTSAKALGEGHRGLTVPLGVSGRIETLDTSPLLPGDLAVTRSGAHVLVYFGDGKWIQADPGSGRVVLLHGRNDRNEWFGAEVSIHRWAVLRGVEFKLALRQVWQGAIDHALRHDFTLPGSLREIPAIRMNAWALDHVRLEYTGKISRAVAVSDTPLLRVPPETRDGPNIVVFLDGHSELALAWPLPQPGAARTRVASNSPPITVVMEELPPSRALPLDDISGVPTDEDLERMTQGISDALLEPLPWKCGDGGIAPNDYSTEPVKGLTVGELNSCWHKIVSAAPATTGILGVSAETKVITVTTGYVKTQEDRSITTWTFDRVGGSLLINGPREQDWINQPDHPAVTGVSAADLVVMMSQVDPHHERGLRYMTVQGRKVTLSTGTAGEDGNAPGRTFVCEKDGIDGIWMIVLMID